jgi:1-deoxy-D-xylulose-5-phosphate reductoisomerase
MKKKIIILGSTGSIGTQALDVISKNPDLFEVVGLSAFKNVELLKKQAVDFKVKNLAIAGFPEGSDPILPDVKCLFGQESCERLIETAECDIVLNALVGAAGLKSTIKALKSGSVLALANKESLVIGGQIVMPLAKRLSAKLGKPALLPVDSEHSAVFQCLLGEKSSQVKDITLTASGGPFRNFSIEQLKAVIPENALKHPTWQMGPKVTIDSATLMNKGLEVIEAHYLFDVDYENIKVLVHPQSIVHCMVGFVDNSVKSLLAYPDMRIPIAYSLTFPDRIDINFEIPDLGLSTKKVLEFYEPDTEKFKCLSYAFEAGRLGKTYPAVLSAANEVAVEAFINKQIGFFGIAGTVYKTMEKHRPDFPSDVEGILSADKWARIYANKIVEKQGN